MALLGTARFDIDTLPGSLRSPKSLAIVFFIFIYIFCSPNVSHASDLLPDEPETGRNSSMPYQEKYSYNQILGIWKTAENINAWVANNFVYDRIRAIKLSANQKTRKEVIPIYDPSEFFHKKGGVCIDLARFGVETLRKIDPNSDPKYLMLEFDPIQLNGNTYRLHWLVSFKRDGMKYFFCDSKRPGYIAGPYNSTQVFINEYEQYRGRKIVAYREVESYQKQRKSLLKKRQGVKNF